jgi:predicted transcriptional regulator
VRKEKKMTEKISMVLFNVNINHNYKDLLLQHLSQLNIVHIKTKPEISDIIEKDKVLLDRIKKLSQDI